jgi:ferredoxin
METIKHNELETLIKILIKKGYEVIGPTIRNNAIVYNKLEGSRDLPIGYRDIQEPGRYRLEKRKDNAYFGYVVGPDSWKKFLHIPTLTMWRAKKNGQGIELVSNGSESTPYAFLGVRACELHAMAIQDKVFMGQDYHDTHYMSVRQKSFIVAVNCTQAGGNCFCNSMNTGPKVDKDYDISLTEVMNDKEHFFLVETGSEKGAEIMNEVPHESASDDEIKAAALAVKETENQISKRMETENIKELLYTNVEHRRWKEVANRCLCCANCTMVCPTCFCTTIEDSTDLLGEEAIRIRKWDSCFHKEFSYIYGGHVRASTKSRYRQWMTHKLASWMDQFGSSGCVGCGRCITWCPVGIDITEEVSAIKETVKS